MSVRIHLAPLGVDVDVPHGAPLLSALADRGLEFPCGGEGLCGGCGVRVLSGSVEISEADRAAFTPAQLDEGWRLACQARADAPLALECGQWKMEILADAHVAWLKTQPATKRKIAIDLGTTTLVAQLIDVATGAVLAVETELNPQSRFGSDIMSRIHAALEGRDLTTLIRSALGRMVERLVRNSRDQVSEVLLVGNTVMHHLFSGRSVEPLSHAPFESPHLAEQTFSPVDLDWPLAAGCEIRFVRCIGGFVGSDILAGIVAAGTACGESLAALVDLGTNGEIAIGNRDRIVCASAAAGPAFEGGSICMGMRAATGAISRITLAGGRLHAAVLGNAEPRGICGSGLVDAVALGLRTGAILPSGRIAAGGKQLPVAGPVILYQSDIRELQLAKGAIAAGFKILLKQFGAVPADLERIYLAGAFGNYVQAESALRIGLLDAPAGRIHAAGNTALRGAKMLLLSGEPALPRIEHISLAADPAFHDEFTESMIFPDSG